MLLQRRVPHVPGKRRRGRRRYPWAELLWRVFAIEVFVCPDCGGTRRLLAAIHAPDAIVRVLAAMGLPWSAPEMAAARSPPGEAGARGGGEEVVARTISTLRYGYTGTCGAGVLTAGPSLDPVQATGFHCKPELECVRDKYVLSWETGATSTTQRDIKVLGLSLVDGTPAGAIHYALGSPSGLLAETGSALASRWSGGDTTSDEALVVWSSGVIVGRRFEATGTGGVVSLGGACGTSGLNDFATYNGTPALGTTFTIELLAPTAPVLALIVGFSQAPAACGPCTIVPSPDVLMAGPGPVPVAVPLTSGLIGFDLYTQWLQWRPSGCPLLPDLGVSNTLKFTSAE